MVEVHVLTDASATGMAEGVVQRLANAGHRVTTRVLPRFPTGDALPNTIQSAAGRCDFLVVVVSHETPNREWVINELALAESYPTVFLAISDAHVPARWLDQRQRLIVPRQPLPARLEQRPPN